MSSMPHVHRTPASPAAPRLAGESRTRLARTCAALAVVMLAVGCQTYRVQSDWDATRSFGDERRVFVEDPPAVEGADPFADNSLLRKRVRTTVSAALAERGFELVDDRARAHVVLTWQVLLEGELRVNSNSTGFGGIWGRRGYGTNVQTTSNVRSFQESTLVIDLLDPSSGDLVWRGWGVGMLSTKDRVRGTEKLDEGVRAILDEFPPNKGTPP